MIRTYLKTKLLLAVVLACVPAHAAGKHKPQTKHDAGTIAVPVSVFIRMKATGSCIVSGPATLDCVVGDSIVTVEPRIGDTPSPDDAALAASTHVVNEQRVGEQSPTLFPVAPTDSRLRRRHS